MKKEKVIRTGISLPKELLSEFDSVIEKSSYTNRSEAIRDAIRNFVSEYKELQESKDDKVGTLIILFDHTIKGASDTLTHIQHHHEDVISSTLHVHLDEENCLEVIIVKGRAKQINDLANAVFGSKGTRHIRSVLFPTSKRNQI
ncbi:MAG: nickel-responsive transcriptional regulator NikR [Candidatus Hodarchaeota archaeon]